MTPKETRQAAAVMLAHAEGKKIEYAHKGSTENRWQSCDEKPIWDWFNFYYRVEPERWSGKIWVHPDGTVEADWPKRDRDSWNEQGWRLIEAKEVEP